MTLKSAGSRPKAKDSLIDEATANEKEKESSILPVVVQVDPSGAEELVGGGGEPHEL